jgi:activator of HSP90 ATPase
VTVDEDPIDVRALTRRLRMTPYTGPVRNLSLRASVGAAPADIYTLLLDERRHTDLIGQPVKIRDRIGTPFDLGRAEGFVTELLAGRHIVLALRLDDDRWPAEYYSTLTMMLRAEGTNTTFVLFQQDVPDELGDEMYALWQRQYVDTLSARFPAVL